jgi:hypothetical protein
MSKFDMNRQTFVFLEIISANAIPGLQHLHNMCFSRSLFAACEFTISLQHATGTYGALNLHLFRK